MSASIDELGDEGCYYGADDYGSLAVYQNRYCKEYQRCGRNHHNLDDDIHAYGLFAHLRTDIVADYLEK